MMTTQAELRNYVWQACTAIRNEHRDVKKYVEYTAVLLFFKFYDDLFDTLPPDIRGLIPTAFRWTTLRALDPRGFAGAHPEILTRLRDFFENRRWIDADHFAAAFENFQFDIKHDEVLSRALVSLDRINFAGMTYDQKGDIYEYLIAKMADAGVKGEFFTPRPIVDLIIQILDPKAGMRVWDPACGTGGFLTRAFEAMAADLARSHSPTSPTYDGALRELRSKSVFGSETEAVSARLARMNMILHGDGHSTIIEFNSLDRQSYTRDRLEIRGKRAPNPLPTILKGGGFDLIMANPPYGGSQAVSDVGAKFKPWHKTAKPEANFLQVMMHSLAPGGRCGVVMPEGVLFRRDEAKIRDRLLRDFDLEAVIGLFKGAFEFADVKACVMIFRRPRAVEKWKGTTRVWTAEARSFAEIGATAERFRAEVEDKTARFVTVKEIRAKALTLKPSRYLRIVPSTETGAEPLSECFEPVPSGPLYNAKPGDVLLAKAEHGNWHVLDNPIHSGETIALRSIDNRLHSGLLRYYLTEGPLGRHISELNSSEALGALLASQIPVPDQERQRQLVDRLAVQENMPRIIQAQITNQFLREWIDDAMFAVTDDQLLATSFGTLVEDVSEYVDPTDEPETEWRMFGVSNEDGVRLGETKLGRDFKRGRKYKRLVAGAIAYNPQRVNVGSVGLIGEADRTSIISPYYPQFSCSVDLDPVFAVTLMRSPYFRRLIEETAIGAVRHELFFSLFTQIEVPIPNLEGQRAILEAIAAEVEQLAPIAQSRQRAKAAMTKIVLGLFQRMRPIEGLSRSEAA